jgi:hypothetical protein
MMTQEVLDTQTLAPPGFDEYINQLTKAPALQIEIDSVPDDFGELYRVWNGWHFLGTFYQNLQGKWIAQPCNGDKKYCCDSSLEAELIVIGVNYLLVTDVA